MILLRASEKILNSLKSHGVSFSNLKEYKFLWKLDLVHDKISRSKSSSFKPIYLKNLEVKVSAINYTILIKSNINIITANTNSKPKPT